MATLEERVTQLEKDLQELRHSTRAGLGAHSMAIGLVHEDTQVIRADVAGLKTDMVEVKGRLGSIEGTLTEILDRLPPRS